MEWELYWLCSKYPDTSYYKGKNRKTRRKTKKHEENGKIPSGTEMTRPCAPHHWPWWALRLARGGLYPSRSICFFNAAFCALLVLRFGPRVLLMLSHFGPPLQASLIHMASQGSLFLQLLGLSHVNLQSKLEKSRKTRKWRNRDVNHKIKHINPQE